MSTTAKSTSIRLTKRRTQLFGATALVLLALGASPSLAQGLQPGEAFATRFSGTAPGADGLPAIDTQGTVGSILDLRAPGQPAQGQHWINEPQRAPISAADVGQVFGVALDDANPPNIYVTATAAFGLHRTGDNAQWMPGMFGRGGPGAIYKLDAANGYKPQLFSVIRLNERQNTGAALGNIAFDRFNRQFLVSDLETGMIHRISLEGLDLGSFDHGTQGRAGFVDAQSGQSMSLQPIAFDPASQARTDNCEGRFDTTPECWNIAESGRRVWGLGVWKLPNGETRLYYSVASSPDLGGSDWTNLPEDDKRNTLWSVRLGPDGSFDASGVRREFVLPDFFTNPKDVARAGYSRPISDITFPVCSGTSVMLVAERGGLRNLGLGQENAFATPHEARTIRYELDKSGTWRAVGRYDVGMYDRSKEGAPYINANCAGGATFGPGYSADGRSTGPADAFVWISGDKLCSSDGPCNPAGGIPQQPVQQVSTQGGPSFQMDNSEVHGVQGQPADMYNVLVPPTANVENQQTPAQPIGPDQAYMVDLDINLDQAGNVIPDQVGKNDATLIGDISVYQQCPIATPVYAMIVDHGRGVSHYRAGSHSRFFSHWRWHSHSRWASHDRRWSTGHDRFWSDGHWRHLSPQHRRHMSPIHWRHISPTHYRSLSPTHGRSMSPPVHHRHTSPPGHYRPMSPPQHQRPMSPPEHKRGMSPPTHSTAISPGTPVPVPGIGHLRALSKNQPPSNTPQHTRQLSIAHQHSTTLSKQATQPKHSRQVSQNLNKGAGKKGPAPKRQVSGTGGGMGGGGMGGMSAGGMGGMGSYNMPKANFQKAAPVRVGPQNFRGPGGNGPFRR